MDVCDSTNLEALRRTGEARGPFWVFTKRQYAGIGRRGRRWVDNPGNFAASVALRLSEPPARLALRGFVAALSLLEVLQELTGLTTFRLKWPNDLLLNGGKLAGILLQTSADGWVVIGIGVNLHKAPGILPEASRRAVSLREETGFDISPERLLDWLAPAFSAWEARLQAEGFGALREAFLAHAEGLGERITVRVGNEVVSGRFETIDETGALVVNTGEKLRIFPAAEILS